jgi:hypothetical protein
MTPKSVCGIPRMRIGPVIGAGLILGLTVWSCRPSSDQIASRRDTTATFPGPPQQQNPLPPNTCRVRSTVVAIDTSFTDASSSDPCAKFPCKATVRIDEVVGYGSAFDRTLSAGQTVTVTFAYTLVPTRLTYPDMKPGLPGLEVGSSFIADVEGGAVGIGDTAPWIRVKMYTLVK